MTIHKINVRFYKLIGIIWNGNGFFFFSLWFDGLRIIWHNITVRVFAPWILRLHSFNLQMSIIRWNVISFWLFQKIYIMCMCHFLRVCSLLLFNHALGMVYLILFSNASDKNDDRVSVTPLCSFMKWRVYCVAILLICTLFVNERTYFLDIV